MPSTLDQTDRDKLQRIIDGVARRGPSAIPRLEARNAGEDAVLVTAVDQYGQNLGVSDMFPPPPGETRGADDLVGAIRRSGILAHTGLNIEVQQRA